MDKAKKFVTNIFVILEYLKPKAQSNYPNIETELENVKKGFEDDNTIKQINEQELTQYQRLVCEIFSEELMPSEVDTSLFDNERSNDQGASSDGTAI